ncbi:hypothetical protein BGX23_003636 [Mortierella sp. AD031]|nr:hypothetical protein BGX23_003636 [Mortierella sp. AD031]KAG0218781.1 hypothetical protein BGX33_005937 [Mortierella sp. NVP41]
MSHPFIDPNSPEFSHKYAQINNLRYHYVEAGDPKGEPLLLVHGFPDLWYGWRYQLKFFAGQGYRVIAIDTIGYGETDAPVELHKYGMKAQCDQLAGLLDALDIPKVTLIGHDWGGAIAWRFGLYHPNRLHGIISVCTPYHNPAPVYRTLDEIIKVVPEFEYQRGLVDPDTIAKMDGAKEATLKDVLASGDCDGQAELDYMVQAYSRNGFRGPLNYYKASKVNFDDEFAHFPHPHQHVIHTPSWMIFAQNDPYLKPYMAAKMGKLVPNLKKTTIETGHFALTEKPDEVNKVLKAALEDLKARRIKASL